MSQSSRIRLRRGLRWNAMVTVFEDLACLVDRSGSQRFTTRARLTQQRLLPRQSRWSVGHRSRRRLVPGETFGRGSALLVLPWFGVRPVSSPSERGSCRTQGHQDELSRIFRGTCSGDLWTWRFLAFVFFETGLGGFTILLDSDTAVSDWRTLVFHGHGHRRKSSPPAGLRFRLVQARPRPGPLRARLSGSRG